MESAIAASRAIDKRQGTIVRFILVLLGYRTTLASSWELEFPYLFPPTICLAGCGVNEFATSTVAVQGALLGWTRRLERSHDASNVLAEVRAWVCACWRRSRNGGRTSVFLQMRRRMS